MDISLETHKKEELRKTAQALKPIVQIGKSGLTPEALSEIGKHLKKRKLIKVKFLKSVVQENSKKELFEQLQEKTQSAIIQQIGHTIVLYRP